MAGRPAKPIELQTRKMSKEERSERQKAEDRLKGNKDKISRAPKWLTKDGKKKYKWFVSELEVTGVLTNLDIDALARYCNALADYERYDLMKQTITDIDELEKVERLQGKAENKIAKGDISFGLNPSARAKIATMNLEKQREEESPLAKILSKRRA